MRDLGLAIFDGLMTLLLWLFWPAVILLALVLLNYLFGGIVF